MLIEAGGEKAAKLRGVAVHGRVRVQGEAEELKFHLYSPQNRYYGFVHSMSWNIKHEAINALTSRLRSSSASPSMPSTFSLTSITILSIERTDSSFNPALVPAGMSKSVGNSFAGIWPEM